MLVLIMHFMDIEIEDIALYSIDAVQRLMDAANAPGARMFQTNAISFPLNEELIYIAILIR